MSPVSPASPVSTCLCVYGTADILVYPYIHIFLFCFVVCISYHKQEKCLRTAPTEKIETFFARRQTVSRCVSWCYSSRMFVEAFCLFTRGCHTMISCSTWWVRLPRVESRWRGWALTVKTRWCTPRITTTASHPPRDACLSTSLALSNAFIAAVAVSYTQIRCRVTS